MANETHNGDLNKSKGPGPSKSEGSYSPAKSGDPEATLRKGNMPKAEVVREAKSEKGACVRAAQQQNSSDGKPYMHGGRNVIPNETNESNFCECGCCDK